MTIMGLTDPSTAMITLTETELKEDMLAVTRKAIEMIGQIINTAAKEAELREMLSLKDTLIISEMVTVLDIMLVIMTIMITDMEMRGLITMDGEMDITTTILPTPSTVLIESHEPH